MKRPNRKNGFTLLELLSVTAITALLISIMMPALSSALQIARSASCSAKIRQIGIAQQAYYQTSNSLMPLSVNDPTMRPWFTFDVVRRSMGLSLLGREYKNRRNEIQEFKPSYPRKFICPSASFALKNSEEGLYPIDRSYGLNAHSFNHPRGVNIYVMKDPSKKLCAIDALDWWVNYWQSDRYGIYGELWLGFETYGATAFRHKEKANLFYWDGHIASVDDGIVLDKDFWLMNK